MLCSTPAAPSVGSCLPPSRLGIAQASFALLSLLRRFKFDSSLNKKDSNPDCGIGAFLLSEIKNGNQPFLNSCKHSPHLLQLYLTFNLSKHFNSLGN